MTGYSLLIVDDDATTHEILGEYLGLSGYAVRHAQNGKEALEMLRAEAPDAVLLDIQMPEMDGFQLMEKLRRESSLATLPVVFLTSLGLPHLKVKGLELGAEDYITKPFHKAEILARIKTVLRRTGRFQRLSATLSGQLADIGLPELLQTLAIGRKTATVDFPEMNGEISLTRGAIAAVRQGAHTGEDAFSRLFYLGRGGFGVRFEELAAPAPEGRTLGIQSSLMEAARIADEVRRLLEAFPTDNPLIEPGAGSPENFDLARYLPALLEDLLVALPGNLQDNAELLIDALKNQVIVAVAAAGPAGQGVEHG
ncbi:MAG: response regulator [Desulfuromonadales bacterium]